MEVREQRDRGEELETGEEERDTPGQAEARRRSDVAMAKSQEAILLAEREREMARLAKEQIAPQEIEKRRIEIAAEWPRPEATGTSPPLASSPLMSSCS